MDDVAAEQEAPSGALEEGAVEDGVNMVRDGLVAIRGGAPFLSGADGRLLLQWLQDEVPVPLILASIEAVAEKRRARHVRTRLTLTACRKSVEAALARSAELRLDAPVTPRPAPVRSEGLAALAQEIADLGLDPRLEAAREDLVRCLRDLAGDERHLDVKGREATQAITRFHLAAWAAHEAEHESLRATARAELGSLAAALSPPALAEMVEEVAHDLLRRRFPAVSARRVWDTLGG